MSDPLTLRAMTAEEEEALGELARSRITQARLRDRARICWLASQRQRIATIKAELGIADGTVRRWDRPLQRVRAGGLAGPAA